MCLCIEREYKLEKVNEIRIRHNLPLSVDYGRGYQKIKNIDLTDNYIVNIDDIDYILGRASKHSLYAINDCLIDGYIPYLEGIRIGICGEGVREGDKLITVKNIAYMTIRVAHQIKNCTDKLKFDMENPVSFLIISPPGCGKTTLLREMIRLISNCGNNCLLIDERLEVAAVFNKEPFLDVGMNTDVVSGTPKGKAIEGVIRAMRPDMIFTDEIYKKEEADVLIDAIRCGLKVGATIHSDNRFTLLKSRMYQELFEYIPYVIELSNKPYVGSIQYEGCIERLIK